MRCFPRLFWTDRIYDFDLLNVGGVYDFEGLSVKKSKFTNLLDFSVNKITKITKSPRISLF